MPTIQLKIKYEYKPEQKSLKLNELLKLTDDCRSTEDQELGLQKGNEFVSPSWPLITFFYYPCLRSILRMRNTSALKSEINA